MKTLSIILLSVTTVCIGAANGATTAVVSPNVYTNVEAPNANGPWTEDSRVHSIHSSTVFSALPVGGATLTDISFRPDSAILVGEQISFGRVQLTLSVTQVEPINLSNTFADNITGTPIVVFDSPWSATVVNADPPGAATRPFDFRIPFQTPYHYDPADGNLLVDWILEPLVGVTNEGLFEYDPTATSDQHSKKGPAGSLVSDEFSSFAVVNEFTFIPEPSTLILAGLLGVTAVGWRRRPA